MKYAICLFGQPREFNKGYSLINEMIKNNKNDTFDIYFHCWIDDNITFSAAKWRNIDINTLKIGDSNKVKTDILDLFKPINYIFEKPLDNTEYNKIKSIVESSLMYKNCTQTLIDNTYNIISQYYSRNKVRDLLNFEIENNNREYDMVIQTRFDGYSFPKIMNLDNINKNFLYVDKMYYPRKLIPDYFLIIPVNVYLKWFDILRNLPNIINNENLQQTIISYKENFIFNAEELVFANYLYFYDLKDIKYLCD